MLQTQLPKTPASAARARRLIDRLGLDPDARATALLLVTELVTNVVRHAGDDGEIGIDMRFGPGGELYVAIANPGAGFEYAPRSPSRGHDDPGGWGLHLVNVLSNRWGIEDSRVWFELAPADTA